MLVSSPRAGDYKTHWEPIVYRRVTHYQPSSSLRYSFAASATAISHLHVRAAPHEHCWHIQDLRCRIWMSYRWTCSCSSGHPVVHALLLATCRCFPPPQDSALPPGPRGYPHPDMQTRIRHGARPEHREAHTCCWRWHRAAQGPKGAAFQPLYSSRPSLSTHWLPLLADQGMDWKNSRN